MKIKNYVKLIIEKRKKEIDKQLGENKMKKTLFIFRKGNSYTPYVLAFICYFKSRKNKLSSD